MPLDRPRWGETKPSEAKLELFRRWQGFAVSGSTVDGITDHLVGRGTVDAVPTLRLRKDGQPSLMYWTRTAARTHFMKQKSKRRYFRHAATDPGHDITSGQNREI